MVGCPGAVKGVEAADRRTENLQPRAVGDVRLPGLESQPPTKLST